MFYIVVRSNDPYSIKMAYGWFSTKAQALREVLRLGRVGYQVEVA